MSGGHRSAVKDPPARLAQPMSPAPDVFAAPARGLSIRRTPVTTSQHRPAWLFVAAHGGTGTKLLARMSWQPWEMAGKAASAEHRPMDTSALPTYGMSAGRSWPDPRLESTAAVVVVCRTTMRGLGWARDLAAQYAAGAAGGLYLAGLVTVGDQPGRLPRPLAAARSLLAGAYRQVWDVPYVPSYRLLTGLPGEDCPPIHPAIERVLDDIRNSTTPTWKGLAS